MPRARSSLFRPLVPDNCQMRPILCSTVTFWLLDGLAFAWFSCANRVISWLNTARDLLRNDLL